MNFWSFSAADGQMSGQMSIQLTYLNRAFHGLSIDMSHDPEHIFSIFGVVTPPPGGGSPLQKLKKFVLGHVTYQSKAHKKLYSNMSIQCSFDHSFDRQQLKMTGKSFFYNCFFQGSMSTPNEIRS